MWNANLVLYVLCIRRLRSSEHSEKLVCYGLVSNHTLPTATAVCTSYYILPWIRPPDPSYLFLVFSRGHPSEFGDKLTDLCINNYISVQSILNSKLSWEARSGIWSSQQNKLSLIGKGRGDKFDDGWTNIIPSIFETGKIHYDSYDSGSHR